MCSHVGAVNLDPSSRDSSESIGGKLPSGGVDRKEDHHHEPGPKSPERLLRSASHYRRELARKPWMAATILEEATLSLEAWRRNPPPVKDEWPKITDPFWRRWVGESDFAPEKIGQRYNLNRRYIARIKAEYAASA